LHIQVDEKKMSDSKSKYPHILLRVLLTAWAAAVVVAATSGALARVYPPLIAAIVAATIILPTVWYFASAALRDTMDRFGHRRIVLFHTWRIPAALLFFWYGLQGQLPPLFWILAGIGDLIAGSYALWLSFRPESAARYRSFHIFGFADFVVAVGTGLTYTLLLDPRMAPIATLPLALVPLFGVGISGATHVMAFDMLRRGAGLAPVSAQGETGPLAAKGA
jgi:hypothetical protein